MTFQTKGTNDENNIINRGIAAESDGNAPGGHRLHQHKTEALEIRRQKQHLRTRIMLRRIAEALEGNPRQPPTTGTGRRRFTAAANNIAI